MIAPSCSFYGGTHPTDSKLRDGIRGPELGKPIIVGDDVWIGGNVTVLPGVTIGDGCTVGAASVVSKVRFIPLHTTSFPTATAEVGAE